MLAIYFLLQYAHPIRVARGIERIASGRDNSEETLRGIGGGDFGNQMECPILEPVIWLEPMICALGHTRPVSAVETCRTIP